MGLDAVELLMLCEEEFKVRIPDEDASQCVTPRILSDTIIARLKTESSSVCPSQWGFYRVRQALIKVTPVKRKEILPGTQLTSLARNSIPEFWERLEKELAAGSLPKLEFSKRTKFFLNIAIPFLASLLIWYKGLGVSVVIWGLIVYFILVGNISHRYGRNFPSEFKRVKDLIPLVSSLSNKKWSDEEVLEKIMFITSEQTGLNRSKFNPDSRFVDDIGLS